MRNPFKYGGIVRGEFFADRKAELDELTTEMKNIGKVFLVSPRRFGKTCLLANLRDRLEAKKICCAYMDLFAFPETKSLASGYASATLKALETNRDKLFKLITGLQHLRPKATVDPDGKWTFSFDLSRSEGAVPSLLDAMAYADKIAGRKKKTLVVMIDEFSDLPKYNGGSIEKALRSEIQRHEHVGYIFAGSEPSIMNAMYRDKRRAFYKLGRLMALGPIDRDIYTTFIIDWMDKGGYSIDPDHLKQIFDTAMDTPFYVQRMCHVLWELAREHKTITSAMVEKVPVIIVNQDNNYYESLWHTLTQPQKRLVMALSLESDAQIYSKDFQLRHEIGPSSSIKGSIDALIKKGFLYRRPDNRHLFTDAFFKFWIAEMLKQ